MSQFLHAEIFSRKGAKDAEKKARRDFLTQRRKGRGEESTQRFSHAKAQRTRRRKHAEIFSRKGAKDAEKKARRDFLTQRRKERGEGKHAEIFSRLSANQAGKGAPHFADASAVKKRTRRRKDAKDTKIGRINILADVKLRNY